MLIDGFIGQRNEALSTVSSSASKKKRFRRRGRQLEVCLWMENKGRPLPL